MNNELLVKAYLEKAKTAKTVEEAHAFVESALIAMDPPKGSGSVRLLVVGRDHLIDTIKEIRHHTRAGLREAKDMVDNAPCVVYTGDADTAERLHNALSRLGDTKSQLTMNHSQGV